jgi:hypothetical protein
MPAQTVDIITGLAYRVASNGKQDSRGMSKTRRIRSWLAGVGRSKKLAANSLARSCISVAGKAGGGKNALKSGETSDNKRKRYELLSPNRSTSVA